jgi:hypothetical protein
MPTTPAKARGAAHGGQAFPAWLQDDSVLDGEGVRGLAEFLCRLKEYFDARLSTYTSSNL